MYGANQDIKKQTNEHLFTQVFVFYPILKHKLV